MEMVRLRYISDKPSIRFKKGRVYEGFRAKDDSRELFWCFHVDDDDDPGDYAYSAANFEVVPNDEDVSISKL